MSLSGSCHGYCFVEYISIQGKTFLATMCNFHHKLLCPNYVELCFPYRIKKKKKRRNKGLGAINEVVLKYKQQKWSNLTG